jgi:hypothetical protein
MQASLCTFSVHSYEAGFSLQQITPDVQQLRRLSQDACQVLIYYCQLHDGEQRELYKIPKNVYDAAAGLLLATNMQHVP